VRYPRLSALLTHDSKKELFATSAKTILKNKGFLDAVDWDSNKMPLPNVRHSEEAFKKKI
jgi:hypothetical protein